MIWRGRHVSDPTELSTDEATAYSLPHLHTHVVPRHLDDGEPGHPAHFMRADMQNEPKIPEAEYARDLAALRAILEN